MKPTYSLLWLTRHSQAILEHRAFVARSPLSDLGTLPIPTPITLSLFALVAPGMLGQGLLSNSGVRAVEQSGAKLMLRARPWERLKKLVGLQAGLESYRLLRDMGGVLSLVRKKAMMCFTVSLDKTIQPRSGQKKPSLCRAQHSELARSVDFHTPKSCSSKSAI